MYQTVRLKVCFGSKTFAREKAVPHTRFAAGNGAKPIAIDGKVGTWVILGGAKPTEGLVGVKAPATIL